MKLPISPLVGEMSGRTERGNIERHASPSITHTLQRDMKVVTDIDFSTLRVTPPNRNSLSREWL